ncbi:MAG: hypothetical protein ACRDN0_08330 [Trebonia sp.]
MSDVVAAEVLPPVPVRIELIDQHRALLAAVPGEIRLPVSVQVQPACHDRAVRRAFPRARVHGLALP